MPQERQFAAKMRRRSRARVAALSFAIFVLGASKLASYQVPSVSDANPPEGLEFFDVPACAAEDVVVTC